MGEIVGAGLIAHVPTIVLPDHIRRELNNGRESTLFSGLQQLRREVFDLIQPDLVLVFDSHWFTTVEFVISSADRRSGFFTSEELPRGMSSVPYDLAGHRAFAELVGEIALEMPECWITPIDNPHLPPTYATLNLAPFLQRGPEAWLSMSTCQTAQTVDFAVVGRVVAEAVRRSDLRVALIASGALSHTFHSLRTLRQHEAAGEEHIFSDAAREWDHRVVKALEAGNHAQVITEMEQFMAVRPEGHFAHYQMMVNAIGGVDCTAPGRAYSDYENAIGTGQIHLWFDKPSQGWSAS
jgi:aromatic ring-opening dioxygenase catalytic subunit (LigB family)